MTTTIDEDGFETITDESPTGIELEVGEVFTGIKVGMDTAEFKDGKTGNVYLLRSVGTHADGEIEDGELCSVIESYKLRDIAKVPDGHIVRLTRMKDVPMTGNGRQPMKDYKVQSKAP